MRWWESFRPTIEQTMIANALISRLKEKLPLTYLQFTSKNKLATIAHKSKNLYFLSMHKSYYFNSSTEHTTVKWAIVHCLPFICLHRGVAWDFEGKRTEEKLERQRRSKLGRGSLRVYCSRKRLNSGSRKCRFLRFSFSVDKWEG